jgi:hypothetical protein
MHWQFSGRDDEVELVRQTLARPGLCGVLVRAAPGMGRSRLVAESLWPADESRYALMPLLGGRADRRALSTLRLSIAQYVDDIEALELVRRPPDEIASRLAQSSGGRRVVMSMDDVHLMDDESLTVAVELLRRDAVAIATVPAYDLVPERLRPLVASGLLRRLELAALEKDAVRDLVAGAIGRGVTESTVSALHQLSRGNPRILRRLTISLGAQPDVVGAREL